MELAAQSLAPSGRVAAAYAEGLPLMLGRRKKKTAPRTAFNRLIVLRQFGAGVRATPTLARWPFALQRLRRSDAPKTTLQLPAGRFHGEISMSSTSTKKPSKHQMVSRA